MRDARVRRGSSRLWVCAVLWLGAPLVGIAADEPFVVYKTTGGRELRLFIDEPPAGRAEATRPAVVYFHGGGWVQGTPNHLMRYSRHLAQRGVVGFRVEYRLVDRKRPEPPVPCIEDAKSALRFVRANAGRLGVDPARIAAAGGSAGAHLAVFAALVEGMDDQADDHSVSCRPDALILFNPVLDLGPGNFGHERVKERYRDFSPAHHVSSGAPPMLVLTGADDTTTPLATIEPFVAAMRQAGNRCELVVYPGAGHSFFNKEPFGSQTLAEVTEFVRSLGWIR